MNNKNQKRIALISVHGDPAIEIGKEEAENDFLTKLLPAVKVCSFKLLKLIMTYGATEPPRFISS